MPQTIDQFGQSIKAKHPEYGDMSDADVGRAVLKKYPQYGDMVQGYQPPTPSRPAGLPTGVALPQPGGAPMPGVDAPPSLLQVAKQNFNSSTAPPPAPTGVLDMLSPKRALQNVGAGAGDTLRGLYHTFTDKLYDPSTPAPTAEQIAAQGAQQIHQFGQDPIGAYTLAAGQAGTGLLLGKAAVDGAGAAADAMRPTLNTAGDALQNIAAGNLNRRMNIGTKDRQYGQNPGRGVLDSGIGISTRNGLQQKVDSAMDASGGILSNIVRRADVNANAPAITSAALRPAIDNPVNSQISVVQGIGSHVADAEAPLNVFRQKAALAAPGATAPIYGPNAPETVLPSDLWKSIRNIDKNTRFNPQPEIESVNEVGRAVRQNLRPHLESVDPSIQPISQTYSDLASAQTALDRQGAPYYKPQGLHALIQSTLDSYPVQTGLSAGVNKLGGLLKRTAGVEAGPAASPFAYKMGANPLQLPANVPITSGYGPDFSNGSIPSRPAVITPAPQSMFALPSSTMARDVQPMVGIKAPQLYPPLAEDFAKTRIAPTVFSGPPENPFDAPRALLNAENPKPTGTARKPQKSR